MADPLTSQQRENLLYTGSPDLSDAKRYDMGTITASIDMVNLSAQQEKEMMTQRGMQASDWERMVKGGDDGFKEVAQKRGFLSQYESAVPLIGGDSLRKKLTRDLMVMDLTGADEKQMASGVPQLQVAKSVLGLTDATDEAFDKGLDGFIDKQIDFRSKRDQLYKLASQSALNGTKWEDMMAEATTIAGGDITPFKDVINQGRSDVFKILRPQDVAVVNNLWEMTKQVGGMADAEAKGNPLDSFASYEEMTPKERDGVMRGIAMRAEDEGQDIDGAFNRIGAALRSGTLNVGIGLVSREGRIESDALQEVLKSGTVPAKFKDEITPKNVAELARDRASAAALPSVEIFGVDKPKAETRPLTDNEKLTISQAQKATRGAARFSQDLKNAGIKAKEYRREATKGGWFFGDSLENTVVNLAESVPSMVVTAIPVLGPMAMQASYAESARARIESQFPNASEESISLQANAEGAWMAGADIIQNKLFASKVPALNAAILKLGKPGGVALFAGRAVTTGVLETGQEVFQDAAEPVIQSLAAALNEDIKGPDWGAWLQKEYTSLGDIFRVSMLMGIVGGAGSTISDYMDGSKLRETLMDKRMLELNGINPDAVASIAKLAETNPAAAAQMLQGEQLSTSPETRMQNAQVAMRKQELETANTTLREAGLPELSQQEDGRVLVQYNDGITNDRIFDTPEEAKASMDAVFEGQQVEMSRVNRELIEELEGRYKPTIGNVEIEQSPVRSSSLQEAVTMGETTPDIARQRARIYLRNAKDQMGISDPADDSQIDSILGRLMIQGSSRNEYAGEVTRMVLQIKDGAKPTVVFEEAIEAFGKWMIDKGGVAPGKMYQWVKDTEAKTGEVLIAENFRDLSPDLMFQELIEAWSRIGVAHATGRIADSQLSQQIKDFFKAIRQMISDVLNLASKVRDYTDSSSIDPEFRMWLDRAAGFDTEGEIATQQQLADAEVLSQIGESFSIQDAADLEYRIQHRPLTIEGGASRMDDLMPSFGEDIYGPNALQYFGSGDLREREVLRILKSARGNPDHEVTIYRGIPDGVTAEISPGDWVTLSRKYAEEYGSVISKKVKARDVTAWADALLENGYDPQPIEGTFAVTSADPISSAIDAIRKNPDEFVKFATAAKVAVADVNRRASQRVLNSNLRQRDFDQFRDIAKLEAIARALPGELRGILTSDFRKVAEMRTTEGRERYIASLLPKVEQAIENNLQKTLRKEIGKLLKKGALKITDSRNRESKIGTSQAAFDQAKAVMKWRDDKDATALEKTEAAIESFITQLSGPQNVPDVILEETLMKLEATQIFGDWLNADSSRLTQALEFLQGKYDEGRAERIETLKARRDLKESRISTFLKAVNREGDLTEAQRDQEVAARDSLLKKLSEGFMQAFLKPHQTFARLAEAAKNDPALKGMTRRLTLDFLNATNQQSDFNFQDNAALKNKMMEVFKAKTDIGVSSRLMQLLKKERPPVERSSGFVTESANLPLNQIEAALNGDLDQLEAGGEKIHPALREMSDEDMIELEQVWEDWNLQPEEFRKGKRTLPFEVTRLKQDGERQQLRRINQLEGLYLWLTMRQPDQAKKLERLGYDEATFQQLDSWLKDDVKELGLWMADYIDGDAFTVDAIHRSEKGIGIKFVTNYFPVRVERGGSDNSDLSLEGGQNVGGMSAGFIKQRVNNKTEPALVNAFSVFLAHRAQVNFWRSHVTPLREWKSVINDDRFAKAVRNVYGDTYYNTLSNALQRIEKNGRMNAAMALTWDKAINKWIGNFAAGTLGLRLSTMMVNLTAGANFTMAIPAGDLAVGMARAVARPDSFKEVLKHPEIQRRYRQGSDPVVQAAMSSGSSLGANPLMTASSKFAQAGVMPIGWIDTSSQIFGAAAVYEYTRTTAIESGLSEEKAIQEANEAVDLAFLRSSQPVNPLAKSEFEQRLSESTAVAKFFGMFASDSFNKLAIMYLAAREAFTGKGVNGRAMATQSLFASTVMMGAMTYIIRSFYQALANPEDKEDEELWNRFWARMSDPKKWAYSVITEPFKSVPLIGEAFNQGMGKLLGQKTFAASRDPLGQNVFKLAYTVNDLVDDDPNTQEEAIEGGITLMQAIGSSIPGLAPLAQLGNLADATEGIMTADGDSDLLMDDEDRSKRIKARVNLRIKELDEFYGKTTNAAGKIDKDIQKKKRAGLADALRAELQGLSEERLKVAISALVKAGVAEAAIKQAGFKVEKK